MEPNKLIRNRRHKGISENEENKPTLEEYDNKGSKGQYKRNNFSRITLISLLVIFIFSYYINFQWSTLPKEKPTYWNEWKYNFLNNKISNVNFETEGDVYKYKYDKDTLIKNEEFDSDLAYSHLLRLATKVHSYNTQHIKQVENYLLSYIEAMKQLSKELYGYDFIEVDFDKKTELIGEEILNKMNKSKVFHPTYFQSNNIIVRIHKDYFNKSQIIRSYNKSALLLSAHYDSQSTSPGASDNGLSVVTLLEALRLNILNLPKHNDLIFNFNSAEEKGLFGSKAFLLHEWKKDVKGFINLEASGVGNKGILFQSSSKLINQAFSNSPHKHSSVIAFTAFKLRLINSRTDYQIYYDNNIPGVDFAIYSNRAFYHTFKDNIDWIFKPSVKMFGESVISAIKLLADSNELTNLNEPEDGGVFFDVLGFISIVCSTQQFINLCIILLIIQIISIIFIIHKNRSTNFILPIIRGLISIFLIIIIYIAASMTSNAFWISGSGMSAHSYSPYIFTSYYILGIACFGLGYYFWIWYENIDEFKAEQLLSHSISLFWLIINVCNIYVLNKGLGLLYFLSIFAALNLLFNIIINLNNNLYFNFIMQLINLLISSLILQEIVIAAFAGLSQTIPTGTQKAIVYYFTAILGMIASTLTLNLIPKMYSNTPIKKIMGFIMIWLSISLLIFLRFPLNPNAPQVFHVAQNKCISTDLGCQLMNTKLDAFNLDNNNSHSYVGVTAPAYIDKFIDAIPSANQFPLSEVHDFNFHQRYFFKGSEPTFPIEDEQLISVELIQTKKVKDSYSIKIQLTGYESNICLLSFYNNKIDNIFINTNTTSPLQLNNYNNKEIILMKRNFDDPFQVQFELNNDTIRLGVACAYDDPQYIPIIDEINVNLPDWAVLSTNRVGVLYIFKDVVLNW